MHILYKQENCIVRIEGDKEGICSHLRKRERFLVDCLGVRMVLIRVRNVGANSLQRNSLIRKASCRPYRGLKCRRRGSLSTSIILMILLVSLVETCESFRQEPVASPNRSTRSATLSSQKNLVEDVQEGETSRLQRLLPSAWRNKNMLAVGKLSNRYVLFDAVALTVARQ